MWIMTKSGRAESEGVRKEVTHQVEAFMGLRVSLLVPGDGAHFLTSAIKHWRPGDHKSDILHPTLKTSRNLPQ